MLFYTTPLKMSKAMIPRQASHFLKKREPVPFFSGSGHYHRKDQIIRDGKTSLPAGKD
jgi:hypothetical protein